VRHATLSFSLSLYFLIFHVLVSSRAEETGLSGSVRCGNWAGWFRITMTSISDGWELITPPHLLTEPPIQTKCFESTILIGSPPRYQARELEWLLEELHETLRSLKNGLEHCYALLAPIDPGSTLVLTTHRNEMVKGHITRVGTRVVKGVGSFTS